MSRPATSLAVGLSLLLAPMPATAMSPAPAPAPAPAAPLTSAAPPAKAAEPESRAPSRIKVRAALRVGTTDYGSSRISPGLVARIEALGLQELRSAGIITAVNGEYTVELVIAPLGDESYVSTVTAFRGDEEITSAHRRSRCELCLEDELLVQVKGLMKSTAEILDRHANPPPAVADKETATATVTSPTQPTEATQVTEGPRVDDGATGRDDGDGAEAGEEEDGDDEAKPRRLGKAGRAGIGSLVLGSLALGSGIGLFVVGEERGANYQIPSFVLMGTGALALVTGIGLLVVDRETRRANQASVHRVAPMVGRGGGGVMWVGRF